MKAIDISNLHVSLAYAHTDTLHETARRVGVKVFFGIKFRVLVVQMRGGGIGLFRGRPGAAPPGLWSVLSWIYRGSGLRLPVGRNT